MASAAPALPWGVSAAPAGPAPDVEIDLPTSLGLTGTRIEVKWEVHDPEASGAGNDVKWWGAVVEAGPPGDTDGDGRKVYVLRYDADPEAGYAAASTNRVTFLADHELYDLGEDDELVWRREGEAWEEEEAGEAAADGEEGSGGEEGESVSMAEVREAMEAWEKRRGYTSEQAVSAMLSTLPAERQRVVATGFAEFSAALIEGVKGLLEAKGADHVVSRADIEEILADAQRRAMDDIRSDNF